jgi:hypothetical protein
MVRDIVIARVALLYELGLVVVFLFLLIFIAGILISPLTKHFLKTLNIPR